MRRCDDNNDNEEGVARGAKEAAALMNTACLGSSGASEEEPSVRGSVGARWRTAGGGSCVSSVLRRCLVDVKYFKQD